MSRFFSKYYPARRIYRACLQRRFTPSFFAGIIVVLVLSVYFRWLPPIAFVPLWEKPWDSFQQLIFPALALGFASQGLLMRITRAQLLEVMRQDYVRTAYAKGLTRGV